MINNILQEKCTKRALSIYKILKITFPYIIFNTLL